MNKTVQVAKINDGTNKITVSKKDGKYIVYRHWREFEPDENAPAIVINHKKKIGEYTEMKTLLYDLYRTW